MLREISGVAQEDGRPRRRWFQDEFFDLFLWQREDGHPESFQLCYDRQGRERAIAWHRIRGFAHFRVDDGESRLGGHKMSPLLGAGGRFLHRTVRTRLRAHTGALDRALLAFVLAKMREYGREIGRGPGPSPARKMRRPGFDNPDGAR